MTAPAPVARPPARGLAKIRKTSRSKAVKPIAQQLPIKVLPVHPDPQPQPSVTDPGPPPVGAHLAPGRRFNPDVAPGQTLSAGDLVLYAERVRTEVECNPGDLLAGADAAFADATERRARELLPDALVEFGAGGELIPSDTGSGASNWFLRDTLSAPDYVAADASRERTELARKAGALNLALDTADSIEAKNTLERMLAHQVASAHASAMKLSEQMHRCLERMTAIDPRVREQENIQATRLAGAIARMTSATSQAALTLQRLRTGGRQIVQVVHQTVEVNEGGQAVVAGKVKAGGPRQRKGGGCGNGR